jgi:hypothetical protein
MDARGGDPVEVVLSKCLEAAIIAALLVFNAALGYFREGHAQATLAALKSRLALNASVRRDNCWATGPAAGPVPGDIVKLSLGAVFAADVRLIEGEILLDQSMLTANQSPSKRARLANLCRGARPARVSRRGGYCDRSAYKIAPRTWFASRTSKVPSRKPFARGAHRGWSAAGGEASENHRPQRSSSNGLGVAHFGVAHLGRPHRNGDRRCPCDGGYCSSCDRSR